MPVPLWSVAKSGAETSEARSVFFKLSAIYANSFVIYFVYVYTKVLRLIMVIDFDWDDGNWPKCGKHGVSRKEIEEVLLGEPMVMEDPHPTESRMRAIGKTGAGRYVFLVFMYRDVQWQQKLRPISARYMHQKEIDYYENQR